MEKKFKLSEQPLTSKIIYASVIVILCASAVIVGIVAANNRKNNLPNNPPVIEEPDNTTPPDENQGDTDKPDETEKKELTFLSPTVGTIETVHSLTVPVFSDTLSEWRVHTGIDIGTELGAEVYASADGVVGAIYNDPMYGITVEIVHSPDIKTLYSNLDETLAEGIAVGKEVKSGDLIGVVGDTALYEIAQEPHLHFGFRVKDVAVNPLDYLSEESKKASLGIESNPSI